MVSQKINNERKGWFIMSDRERAAYLLDKVPDYKLVYVINYLEGASIPDEDPNEETIEAFEEGERILSGQRGTFYRSTEDARAAMEA